MHQAKPQKVKAHQLPSVGPRCYSASLETLAPWLSVVPIRPWVNSDAVVLKAFGEALAIYQPFQLGVLLTKQGLFLTALEDLLPSHPFVAPPITSPLMFAEDDMRVSEPTIVVNDDPRVRRVAVLIRRVPAHVFRTNDPRRSGQGRKD